MYIRTITFYLITFFFLASCTSSKQQFEKGNYEKAVSLSIKKLRKNPNNNKQKSILKSAYGYAVQIAEEKIKQQQNNTDRFKWDAIIAQYRKMQQLYNDLLQCPSCLTVVRPVDQQNDLNAALIAGAQVYVEEGIKAMDAGTKISAREAFSYFEKAKNYNASYANIDRYLADAKIRGTEVIGISRIPVASKNLEINTAFFLQQLTMALNGLNYRFAEFHPIEALLQANDQGKGPHPDQIIDISFDDYIIGQTYLKETRETVVRDSVMVGEISDSLGTKYPVYGKVEATLQRFDKTLESGGVLNIAILDPITQNLLFQQKIPSSYLWENHWATYQGDKRALTKEQIELSKSKELLPPPPQELFYAFTRPLFDQTASLLRRRYRYLRK